MQEMRSHGHMRWQIRYLLIAARSTGCPVQAVDGASTARDTASVAMQRAEAAQQEALEVMRQVERMRVEAEVMACLRLCLTV